MNRAKLALIYIFHPLEAMDIIKRERTGLRIFPVVLMYSLAICSRLFSMLIIHYPLSSFEQGDINIALEIVKTNGLVLSWVIAAYAISSIMGGEARFLELFTASGYAYIPFIVLTPVIAGLSHFMSANDSVVYAVMQGVAIGWLVLGLLFSFIRQCDYGLGRVALVGSLSLVLMLLIWGLLILLVALCGQAFSFLNDIREEIVLKWF